MPDRTQPNSAAVSPSSPPTVAILDLAALAHNLDQVRRLLAPGCDVLAVVKADAYGHGAVTVSRTLAQLGITYLGVSTLAEGIELREAGLKVPVLVMGALLADQLPDAVAHQLTPVICEPPAAQQLATLVQNRPAPYPVHIKVDTGMGRLGLTPEEVPPMLQSPPFKGTLRAEGLMTHLADADGQDPAYTLAQIARFRSLQAQINAAGVAVPLVHAANSAAILRYPDSHGTAVRPGLMLYGYHTTPVGPTAIPLQPVLSLRTRVVQVKAVAPGQSVGYNRAWIASRPSRIAVLPIGYGDGYARSLSNRGAVLLHGTRAPIVGRVCMDLTMVDVTEIPSVQTGDEAVVIGRQGSQQISAQDLAAWQDTIPYEVLCALGKGIPRLYTPPAPTA